MRRDALHDPFSHSFSPVHRFMALRRMGHPPKTCFLIALNTKMPLNHPSLVRPANTSWQNQASPPPSPGLKTRLARLLPKKFQPASSPPPPIAYAPFTVNIERMGEQYRATLSSPHTASTPPPADWLRPPDPVYRQGRSVVDLPSYGEANRDVPPRYGESPEAQQRADSEEETTVEHNFVS